MCVYVWVHVQISMCALCVGGDGGCGVCVCVSMCVRSVCVGGGVCGLQDCIQRLSMECTEGVELGSWRPGMGERLCFAGEEGDC